MSKCTKCGATSNRVTFHTDSGMQRGCGPNVLNSDDNEHLHYFCSVCGYDWTGPTKDKEDGKKEYGKLLLFNRGVLQ